ncbi:MAG: DUF2807 domain-containing protein [Candidatus Omnitrophota bacterium]
MLKTLIILFLGCILIQGCDNLPKAGKSKYRDGEITGSGLTSTQIFDSHEFDGVQIDRSFDVTLAAGISPRVTVTADDNIASLFIPKIIDGILRLEFSKGFTTTNEIKILIESPDIERINHQGTGTVLLDNLKLKFLDISMSGSGKVTGLGEVDKLWIDSTGKGTVLLQDLPSRKCEVLMSGPGQVVVTATEELNAVNRGKGEIIYYGNPEVQTIDNSGSGQIKRK